MDRWLGLLSALLLAWVANATADSGFRDVRDRLS